jgi:hypothetical protein
MSHSGDEFAQTRGGEVAEKSFCDLPGYIGKRIAVEKEEGSLPMKRLKEVEKIQKG